MDVVAYGVPVMDFLMCVSRMPGPDDEGVRVTQTSWQYGGKVATAMAAVARLGARGGIAGPYGGLPGEYIKKDFERHGLDTSRMILSDAESPMFLCLADLKTGGRTFLPMNPGKRLSHVEAGDLDKAYMTSGKYLLISGGDGASRACMGWCRDAGIPVVIDADGYSDGIQESLPLIDHFIPSEFYYRKLFGDSAAYEANLRILRAEQKNPRAVSIVTLGEKGLAGIDQDGEYFELPAHKVDVVDTTGAGDVFHGAYIVGLLRGKTVIEACRFASAVSAIKCTRLGGRAAIATLPVVEEFMRTGAIDYSEIDERCAYYARLPFKA